MSWALRNTLYASAFVLIPYVYVTWRTIYATNLLFPDQNRWLRFIILVPVCWVNIFPLLMLYYYFRDTLLDELVYKSQTGLLDYLFLFPFWIGLIILVEVLPYFLASDLLQLIIKLFASHLKDVIRKWTAILRVVLVVFFALYVIITTLVNTYNVSESSFEIKLKNLPAAFENLNLALIADLQVDRFTQQTKTDQVRDIINNKPPDLLFFGGDLVTRGTEFINQGLDVMCSLKATTERIACLGDHDYWADAMQVANGLQHCSWTFLNNTHRIIPYKGHTILVTGLTYIYSQRLTREQITAILSSAPAADLKILLVHQPNKNVIQLAADFGYDILLAGHTHGGQVVFSPFGYTLTPTKFENVYYSGYYKKDKMNIFVSNGVGLTMMPLRYGAQAQITRIILKK